MPKHENTGETTKNTLDASATRPRRGRPPTVRSLEIYGRGENLRGNLSEVWDRLWPVLSKAETEEEISRAFVERARPYDRNFVPDLSELILRVLCEPTWPKRREPQQRFLADSLAGGGVVTPRRSRDICAQERAKRKHAHRIIRYEYYVECSCGYEGPARDRACRRCGATIPPRLFG